MNLKKWLKELFNNKKVSNDKKNIFNLAVLFLIGVLIIVTISFFKSYNNEGSVNTSKNLNDGSSNSNKQQGSTSPEQSKTEDYEKSMQEDLKNTLEKMDGVGKVEVMISFESGEESVPAVNITDSTNNTEEKDTEGGTRNTTQKNNGSTVVVTNDGSKSQPLIVKTYNPKVSGVCVVAEGAENKITELRISKAITDLFGISEDKVNVYPMKK
ncbi:stage III sporulation protein AG [Clostridium ljungdahlii]|uniref:Stage III sporulation protein AF (Spore_III_AF) n=1 Tax=Clostridium ljungdahlii TaxID=1538 RepID=A0A168LJC6_9CLOT|nr:stage III sporulation protein AG [Clostridium ljungdahlii]OAA83307.1 Stage III sporulation protein AF (Spore_III_AF) [Clostridium ljungdahlii]